MVKLSKVAPRGLSVFVKAEYLNPSGSLKDRIALMMIRDAEARGDLKPGYTIIEARVRGTRGRPSASWGPSWGTRWRYICLRA